MSVLISQAGLLDVPGLQFAVFARVEVVLTAMAQDAAEVTVQ